MAIPGARLLLPTSVTNTALYLYVLVTADIVTMRIRFQLQFMLHSRPAQHGDMQL